VVDQRRFADPRFTGDEDDLSLAAQCVVEAFLQSGKLGSAAYQSGFGSRVSGLWFSGTRNQRQRTRDPDVSDEPIPAPVHRFDVARRLRVIAQRRTQLLDATLEHGIADGHLTPDAIEELILGH